MFSYVGMHTEDNSIESVNGFNNGTGRKAWNTFAGTDDNLETFQGIYWTQFNNTPCIQG